MVHDHRGRSHSSPGYSYSGRNYHREKTPEEKERQRIERQQRKQQQQLEQEVKTSSKFLPTKAAVLVQQGVVKEAALWREFLQTLGGHFDTKVVAILAATTVDGVLPFGDLVAAGIALSIAVEIYQNWNPLWNQTISQIVTTTEPGNQVYKTPTDEQVEAQRHTGHAPSKVETGTPGYDTESAPRTPNHTGHDRTEKPAVEYIFESENFDRNKIPGIHVPFRDYSRQHPPNWELIKAGQNTDYLDTQYDCSEIAEDLLIAAKGEGRIVEVTPSKNGSLKLLELGKVKEPFDYHQVYTDGRYVYDPRLDADKPIPKGDWEKLMRGLNPDANFKYLK